jgi:hypothetical protein
VFAGVRMWLRYPRTPTHTVQEGLTAYIEWLISDETGLVTLDGKVQEVMASTFRSERQPFFLIGPINYTQARARVHYLVHGIVVQDIADICFSKPPLIFHMLREAFGKDVLFKFLQIMTTSYKFV